MSGICVICGLVFVRRCQLPSVISALARLIAAHRLRFTRYFAAALPAHVAVLLLCSGNQPKTAARLAQDCRAEKPLVKPYLLFCPHCYHPPVRAMPDFLERRDF